MVSTKINRIKEEWISDEWWYNEISSLRKENKRIRITNEKSIEMWLSSKQVIRMRLKLKERINVQRVFLNEKENWIIAYVIKRFSVEWYHFRKKISQEWEQRYYQT